MQHKWKHVPLQRSLAIDVPDTAGIYAIALTPRVLGLPTAFELLYVGKSKRLRRRYREHAFPWLEHNHALGGDYRRPGKEFWYLTVPVGQLDELERNLIRDANPSANRIRYGRKEQ